MATAGVMQRAQPIRLANGYLVWPYYLRGKHEWTGEWSDKSDRWSDSVQEELGWSKKNDGTFWMTWQGEEGSDSRRVM